MKKIYFLSLIAFLLSSCGAGLNYLGNSFDKTSHVDVYVDQGAIKKRYIIIGKGYEHYLLDGHHNIEKLQAKAVQIAKARGADAILFQDYYLVQAGTVINTSSRIDTIDKGIITTGNTTINPVVSSGRQILFLKYE